MRDFKFRAWDTTNKIMLYELNDDQLNDERPFGGHYLSVMSYGQFTINWIDKHDDWHDCLPLQFTGLLDKTGKEIFEGDLLCSQTVYIRDEEDIKTVPCVVEWGNEKAGFYLVRGKYQVNLAHFLCGWKPTVFEVVGNIYENPELLTK